MAHDASHDMVKGYNAGAMVLHWAIAVAILLQLALGFTMSRLDVLPDALRFAVIQWHKTIGLTVLALTLARIAWRLLNPAPKGAPMSRPERALAGIVHFLFYVAMLAVPISGWLLVSTSRTGAPTLLMLSEALPFPNLPIAAGARAAVHEGAENAHTILAYATAGLLVLHVAGALKHSVIDRAPSFSRMLPVGRLPRQSTALVAIPLALALIAGFLGGGVAIGRNAPAPAPAVASSAAAPAAAAAATGWTIDKAASRLGFEATFSGAPITGEVGNWTAAIVFDPEHPEAASARIAVAASSVTVSDPFVRGNLLAEDGLDAGAHPEVLVELARFERAGAAFLAHGTLSAKGKSVPVEVPFTFAKAPDGTAAVTGSAGFDRTALGLGLGNDPTGQYLAKTIKVVFTLKAAPAAT